MQASKEPWNQGTLATLATDEEDPPLFDITQAAYRNNTFAFTDEELEALEDAKTELRRKHGLRVTKYDLIRGGLHCLLEDYRRNADKSFAVRRLGKKRQ